MRAIFLQVRLDSSRLPRKALLRLGDRTVLSHALRALDRVRADIRCILTTEDSIKELQTYADDAGWQIFAGPNEDVLARYTLAAKKYSVDSIIRATGDNPLVSFRMANAAIDLAEREKAHYAGFSDLPIGSGVEILDVKALFQAYGEATDSYEREHVSPFLYRNPQRFTIALPQAAEHLCVPQARITLDTQEDFLFLTRLFAELYKGDPLELETVVPWLRKNLIHAC